MSSSESDRQADREAPASVSGSGNGRDIEKRLSALETHIKYVATKEDIQKIKVWCLTGVIIGMISAATLTNREPETFSLVGMEHLSDSGLGPLYFPRPAFYNSAKIAARSAVFCHSANSSSILGDHLRSTSPGV